MKLGVVVSAKIANVPRNAHTESPTQGTIPLRLEFFTKKDLLCAPL